MGRSKTDPVVDTYGPCAKREVRCTIVGDDGRMVVGANLCRNPQPVCPRLPGEDYTKCRTICEQIGHAEAVAVALAKTIGISGGVALLEGHERACQGCEAALRELDIEGVTVVYPSKPTTPLVV